MGVQPDHWIRDMARRYGMIEPFSERVDGQRVVSYGLQPAGYDARLHPGIEILDWAIAAGQPLDPLGPQNDKLYFPKSADPFFDVPPHGFVVARTVEHFRIPRNCVVRGAAKTTYSAVGLNLDVASIHPGWEGRLRLHLSNATPVGIRIYGNMGLIYLEFHEIDGTVERAYGDLQNPRFQEGRS